MAKQTISLLAFQGDVVFQAPRRNMFNVTAGVVPHWSFCAMICLLTFVPFIDELRKVFLRGKATPILGTFHGSDLSGNDLTYLWNEYDRFIMF